MHPLERSPHERSDMRGFWQSTPGVASLTRATAGAECDSQRSARYSCASQQEERAMHPALLRPIRAAAVSLLAVLAATPAFAHHVMGGRTPATFMEGLLSGLAHPLIGPDHLAFL